jgi:trehalose 6-phosphate phosphatase
MTLHLFDFLPEIEDKITASPAGVLLLLDFDGTLARIAAEPHLAAIEPRVRKLLARLHRISSVRLGVVSGRTLADVQVRTGLPDLVYAGNHGLEIEGPGISFVHPEASALTGILRSAVEDLRRNVADIPGVLVEDKRLTACLHYRCASQGEIPAIFDAARATVEPYRGQLRITPGLKVINILPEVQWTKGEAVQWIRDAYRCRDFVPIYIGDDVTDEDAFRQLGAEGVTVRVGPSAKTLATYHVTQPAEVEEFLDWLAEYIPAVAALTSNSRSTETARARVSALCGDRNSRGSCALEGDPAN